MMVSSGSKCKNRALWGVLTFNLREIIDITDVSCGSGIVTWTCPVTFIFFCGHRVTSNFQESAFFNDQQKILMINIKTTCLLANCKTVGPPKHTRAADSALYTPGKLPQDWGCLTQNFIGLKLIKPGGHRGLHKYASPHEHPSPQKNGPPNQWTFKEMPELGVKPGTSTRTVP